MYSRKYDFQAGTKISSGQVDEEFNQLISGLNTLESADSSIKALAQMTKLTNDAGGVKLSVGATTGDILETLTAAGNGNHTFYAVGGSKNLPPSNLSIRGMAHITASGFGWAFAFDYNNKFFINYLNNGVWKGWDPVVTVSDTQEELWSGPAAYMQASTTITPSKKLSECRNGWILVWSDYDPGVGANNSDFNYSYVPKFIAAKHNGGSHLFSVTSTPNIITVKKLGVFDNKLTGDDGNQDVGPNDVVLRYVLEW